MSDAILEDKKVVKGEVVAVTCGSTQCEFAVRDAKRRGAVEGLKRALRMATRGASDRYGAMTLRDRLRNEIDKVGDEI